MGGRVGGQGLEQIGDEMTLVQLDEVSCNMSDNSIIQEYPDNSIRGEYPDNSIRGEYENYVHDESSLENPKTSDIVQYDGSNSVVSCVSPARSITTAEEELQEQQEQLEQQEQQEQQEQERRSIPVFTSEARPQHLKQRDAPTFSE